MPASDFLAEINPWREAIACELLAADAPASARDLQQQTDRTILLKLFDHIAKARGLNSPGLPASPADSDHLPHQPDISALPADILGQVYEHCLDHPVHLDGQGQPTIEKHRAARKSAGVFYTPPRIVDYIVGQTLGRLLEKATGSQAAKLKILDPSCGSGSFLIAAYQYLLDWHLAHSGTRALTPSERYRILLDHIHGIDIDPQAVELTRLSLILLAIGSGTQNQVPDLDENIRCGDALAAGETFDWPSAFPGAFERGGFDCIIGNPPYLFGEHLDPADKDALRDRFPSAANQADAYQFFLELNGRLANPSAATGMLVPDAILARSGCRAIRGLLLRSGLERICHCGPVFGAGVSTAVLIQSAGYTGAVASDDIADARLRTRHHCRRDRFETDPERRFLIHATDREHALLERISEVSVPLGDLGTLSRGEELGRKQLSSRGPVPILVGRDVRRYHITPPTRFVASLRKPAKIYQPGKILIVKTGSSPVAAIDTEGHATLQSLYNFHPHHDAPDPRYLLAIINSRLVAWWIHRTFTAYKKLFPQLNQETIAGIPVIAPENVDPAIHDAVIDQVDGATRSNEALETTGATLDRLVGQAFGLDPLEAGLIADTAR